MICPNCRLYISDDNIDFCPRCAQPLFNQPGYMQGGQQPPPGSGYQPNAPTSQSAPGSFSSYGSPSYGSQPYGNQPFDNPYGSSPQYPSGYNNPPYQPPFSPPATPGWQPTPPLVVAPARKSRRGLYVGITVGILVLVLAACVGGFALLARVQSNGVANATPFPGTTPGATIIYKNTLTTPDNDWANDTNCFFKANAYHISGNFLCYAPVDALTDAAISVQVKQLTGSLLEPYGIAFRRASKGNGYEFDIDSNGKWVFFKAVNGEVTKLKDYTANSALTVGLNTTTTLSVLVKGSHFTLFINGTQVGEIDDATFPAGRVGLTGDDNIEVAYTYFQISKAD